MSTPATQLNPLDAATGMRLAFWAYPHKDIEAAERIAKYPSSWRHTVAGEHLPPEFRAYTPAQNGQPAQEGWNTQHDAQGKLVNQFMVSINKETKQVTFDFKGSDNASNFKSDFANAGASEFAQIRAQAQAALETLRNNPDYEGFSYAATGHSLGGGMAQSFALKNNIDAYVYNSLPIARDTAQGDYFKSVGGFEAAVDTYKNSGRTVHDIRTPNDIATTTYDSVMRNQYLSDSVPPGAQRLPGAAIPGVLQGAALSNPLSAAVVLGLAAKDHTMGALIKAQHGLGVDTKTGGFIVPEGHVDFAAIPADVRKKLSELNTSPLTKVFQSEQGGTHDSATSAYHRFELTREDASKQRLSIHAPSGDVDLDDYAKDGQRSVHQWRTGKDDAVRTQRFNAQGERITEESAPQKPSGSPTPPAGKKWSAAVESKWQGIQSHLAPALVSKGFSPQQIEQVSAAALVHLERHESKGGAQRMLVAKDGSSIAVDHGNYLLSEMPIAPALRKNTAEHLHEARQTPSQDASHLVQSAQQPQVESMAPLQR